MERYATDIQTILSTSDLSTITGKVVRKQLAQLHPDLDVKANKDALERLIKELYATTPGAPTAGANDPPAPSSSVHISPKKRMLSPAPTTSPSLPLKTSTTVKKIKTETDAEMAIRLSMEEEERGRRRATRGAVNGPSSKNKKAAISGAGRKSKKVKSNARIIDSDGEMDEDEMEQPDGSPKKKRKAGGGWAKKMLLSEALANVVGSDRESRPQVVKKLWEYIKINNLQNPNHKMEIIPDEKLRKVFSQDRIHGFTMNKHLGKHLYPIEGQDETDLIKSDDK